MRPGNREIPTANIAITSLGANGDSAVGGTVRWIMPAFLIPALSLGNAALMRTASRCLARTPDADVTLPVVRLV